MEEAGIPLAALRVEDPELRPPPRRTEPVAGDGHLRPLAHDVPSETDPRPAGQLQAHPRRLGDDVCHGWGEPRGLEDHEERLRAASQGDEPVKAILEGRALHARIQARWQVDQEEIDRPCREERAGQRETVGQRLGREDDEPLQPDPASDRLDRIERAGKIQPGDDRTGGLGLGGEPQGESGPAARGVPAQGHAGRSGQAAGAEDGVECREAGRDDLAAGQLRRKRVPRRHERRNKRSLAHFVVGEGHGRQCPHGLPEPARRGRSPASLEGRQRGRHVGVGGGHRSADYRTDVLVWQEGTSVTATSSSGPTIGRYDGRHAAAPDAHGPPDPRRR